MGDAEVEDDGIVYLVIEDVIEFFGAIIGRSPEQAADQLRDRDALEGALARPQMHGHDEGSDVAFQGAVLAHGIAESQSFIDGNKWLSWGPPNQPSESSRLAPPTVAKNALTVSAMSSTSATTSEATAGRSPIVDVPPVPGVGCPACFAPGSR